MHCCVFPYLRILITPQLLTAPSPVADPGSQFVAAYAAANLSAYRSGACSTCDGWTPGTHRQTSGEHRRQSSAGGGIERGSPKR